MNGRWRQNLLIISLLLLGSSSNVPALAAPTEKANTDTLSSPLTGTVSTSNFKQAQAEEQLAEESTGQLSAENIRQVLTQIQEAGDQQNVEGILEHVAPFAHSEVSLNMEDTVLTTTVDGIEEHRNLLSQSYSRFTNRKTLEQKVDISVSTDGEFGIVTVYRLREVTNAQRKRLLTGSINTLRFGIVNEKQTIVSASIEGWISERPSPEEP